MSEDLNQAVATAARAARKAAASLEAAEDIDAPLRAMADLLLERAAAVLEANERDQQAARDAGMSGALLDRLRLDEARLSAMAGQLNALADVPEPPRRAFVRLLDDGFQVQEWRRPVGVIGANFEARPNVVTDVASQLIKSRNGGVLRTGSAALASAEALLDEVVAPALEGCGLDPAAIQLVRYRGRASAQALVSQGALLPLVILRGSGESTRELARVAALHDVRTLAHADGGAVLYLDRKCSRTMAFDLIDRSLDRLGVCNRLNLLLVHQEIWDDLVPAVVHLLGERQPAIRASLPPHAHPLGHEWALETASEATVTIASAEGAADAARIANEHTSGLAASIVTEDPLAAQEFLDGYAGTGAFWNNTTRLLDGFKLLGVPETGINIDRVPGPRGPVTFQDLYLRQFVVVPAQE